MATPNQNPFQALPGGQTGGGAFIEGVKKGLGKNKSQFTKGDWAEMAKLQEQKHMLGEKAADNAHLRGMQMAAVKHGSAVGLEAAKHANTLEQHHAATGTLHEIASTYGVIPTSHRTAAGSTTFRMPPEKETPAAPTQTTGPVPITNEGPGGAHVDRRSEGQVTQSALKKEINSKPQKSSKPVSGGLANPFSTNNA